METSLKWGLVGSTSDARNRGLEARDRRNDGSPTRPRHLEGAPPVSFLFVALLWFLHECFKGRGVALLWFLHELFQGGGLQATISRVVWSMALEWVHQNPTLAYHMSGLTYIII